MANTLTTLMHTILARSTVYLRGTLMMPQLVNSDFGAEAKEYGNTIDVDIPQSTTVVDVTPGVTPSGDNVPENSTPVKASIALDKWKMSKPFFLSDKDQLEINAAKDFLPKKSIMALDALAEQVNSDILALYTGVYGLVGTPGTTPFEDASPAVDQHDGIRAMTLARKLLGQQKAPARNRRFVMDPEAAANALALGTFHNANQAGSSQERATGSFRGMVGFEKVEEELAVPTHTAGTITTGAIVKASTVHAVGVKSVVCTTAATTGAVALLEGDIISIAGDTQQYVLTADVTEASASTDYTIAIEPGLKVATAGSEAVTVAASHVVNLAFNRDAFAFVNRPLVDNLSFDGQFGIAAAQDPVSKLSLRLERKRQHKQTVWEYDILYGVKLVHPELAVRVAG